MSNGGIKFGWVLFPTPPRDLFVPENATPTQAGSALMQATERYIEALEPHFDSVWVEDHFQWGTRPTLEAVTTLAYLAGRHEGLRFGNIVLGQSYRNPALTAKMGANLQLMTRGRFILGIGAGWKEDEYTAYGYPYPPAGVRVDELDEAVQIIRAMWTSSPATFHGKYYHIENAECQPQPDPPVPIMIGGGGEQKTLRVVAKRADWWNHNFCDAQEYAHKAQVLRGYCREIGRDPNDIVYTYYGFISIADDPGKVVKREGIHVIGGSADAVTRELEEFIKLGVTCFQFRFLDYPAINNLQTFVEKIMPRLGA